MKILFCGDIVGRSGREAVIEHVPALRRQLGLDFVIVNGENAAHGFGLTGKICDELFAAGVDVITGGNHSWDKSEIIPLMDQDTRLLRPANFPPATPGRGAFVYTDGAGRRIKVINVMTRLFMELLDDPFPAIQAELPPGVGACVRRARVPCRGHAYACTDCRYAYPHWRDGLSDRCGNVRRLRFCHRDGEAGVDQ